MKVDVEAVARGEPPPYASAAPPLPPHVPASSPFAQREAPTFVPPAKAGAAPPAPSAKSTAIGVAPEVAPTRHVTVDVPSGALATSAPSTPTVISGPGAAPGRPVLVYAIAAGVAVFLVLGVITILVMGSSHRDDGEDVPAAASAPPEAPVAAPAPPPSKHGKGKGKGH